ncbi:MAG TPA: hypothetical protein VFN96_07040 [Gemmatimonadales bacterium]|nr:hypothetical protein [Gemmatimonadales bacterium]
MRSGALAFLLGAWAVVLGLLSWSYWRLMKAPTGEKLPPPGSIP